MKTKYVSVMIAALMILLIILISGCTEESTHAAGTDTGTDTATAPAAPASSSGCKYSGTYKGVISNSGDLSVIRYDKDGMPVYTDNPFIAQYDFEMTIQCESDGSFTVTHVKASHPLFACADGCTPAYVNLFIGDDGSGWFGVDFPNGAHIKFADTEGGLQASPDGKTIKLFITGKYFGESIGFGGENQKDSQGDSYFIETYNCQQYGGKGSCMVKTILPNTIILTKVS